MPDTPRTIAELQTLFADGQAPASITPQRMRDLVVSVEAFDTALQDQIDSIDTSATLPAGGTTGQALVKTSDDDFLTEWGGPYVNAATTRTANTVLAGPTSGAAAAGTFRALVAADLPVSAQSFGLSVPIDGAGAVIATGEVVRGLRVTVASEIIAAYLDLDAAGDLAVTVSRATSADPNTYSDLFTVTASAAQNAESTGLSHALAAGDRLRVVVGGTPATTEDATLSLTLSRS